MSAVKDFRIATGMSQTDLSCFLNISRSTLNMAERNQRELPSAAWLKFIYLKIEMDKPESQSAMPAAARTDEEQAAIKKKLLNHAAWQRHKAETIRRRMAKQQLKAEQEKQLQIMLLTITGKHANATPAESDAEWLAYMKAVSKTKFDAKKEFKKQLDLLQHESLLAEAAAAEKIVAEISEPI